MLETRAVLKACVEARASLAELKQAVGLIPNQSILISTLPVLEVQASSAIENIVTTTDNLVQAGVAQRQAASRYLKLLVGIGILEGSIPR